MSVVYSLSITTYIERKSSEFKNNASDIKSSLKVSSTGAYNSITKTPKYLTKGSKKQVYLQKVLKSTDAGVGIDTITNTNKWKNMHKHKHKHKQENQNNISVNLKPVYQMCETGSSVENFLMSSQGNFSSLAGYTNEEAEADTVMCETQKIEATMTWSVQDEVFMYKEKENQDPNFHNLENRTITSKDSVWESGVSEGSIVVQDLPKSKIVFATKKSIDKDLGPLLNYNPIRHENEYKQVIQNRIRKPSNYCEKIVKEDTYYHVESSSSSSDSLNETMQIEIEDEKCFDNFVEHTKVKTSKAIYAQRTQKFDFSKINSTRGYGKKFNELSGWKRTSTSLAKKQQREIRNAQFMLRMAVENGDINKILSILNSQSGFSKAKFNQEQSELVNLIDTTQHQVISNTYCNKIDMRGQDQWTLLHIAANEGNCDVVKVLLEYEANPNSVSANQRTPLHLACMRGYYSVVKELIEHDSNINSSDMDGNTPTHLCSEFGKLKFTPNQIV